MGKFPSNTVRNWLRLYGIQSFSSSKKEVKFFKKITRQHNFEQLCLPIKNIETYPILLGLHFVRKTKHKWDFHNACQIIFDLMTAFEIIPDDNVDYILPFPLYVQGMGYWSHDKDNPGVFITIISNH